MSCQFRNILHENFQIDGNSNAASETGEFQEVSEQLWISEILRIVQQFEVFTAGLSVPLLMVAWTQQCGLIIWLNV